MAKPKKINLDTETFSVPLNKLDPSEMNARRTGRDQGIDELASLIASQGLLQALGVMPVTDGEGQPTDRYAVVYGGRRFAALRLLAERKSVAAAAPIACRLVAGENAGEASLAENSGRIVMHPADQAEAFAALHGSGRGLTVEKIAQRFGVSAHTVKQRLRIGAVSPTVLAHFRAGTLTLEQVAAFAVVDDHAAQERALQQLPEYSRAPHSIRHYLTQSEVPATDRRAAFVGVDAYEAAGGIVRRDLFTEDRGGWFTDPVLLDRLVAEKLATQAEAVRAEGWGWVEVASTLPSDFHSLRRIQPHTSQLSEAEIARLSGLGEQYDDLAESAGGEPAEDQLAELAGIEAEIDAIQDRQHAFRPEDTARAGVFVTLGCDGVMLHRGMLRGNAPDATPNEAEADEQRSAGTVETKQEAKGPSLSATLAGELAAHRTAGLQAQVATRPHLALCLLIEALAGGYAAVCRAHVAPPGLNLACPGIQDSEACRRLAAHGGWKSSVPDGDALLPWLLQQDTAALLDMLAPMLASGVDAGEADWTTEGGARHPAAQVAQLAELDMRTWWQPTVATYLGRVPKA